MSTKLPISIARPKYADERRLYDFDFSKREEFSVNSPADTVSSETFTTTYADGNPEDGQLSVTFSASSGGIVQAWISGGTAGKTYLIKCHIVTSSGAQLDCFGQMPVQ